LTEDEAALWQMFYQMGGLLARLYKKIVSPYVKVIEFQPGEPIPTDNFFYIIYHGIEGSSAHAVTASPPVGIFNTRQQDIQGRHS
jgi:hypothetical protein